MIHLKNVDKPIMSDFLSGQQIQKRKHSGANFSQFSHKTQSFSNLGNVRQSTVSSRGTKPRQAVKRSVPPKNYPTKLHFSQTMKIISYPLGFIALTLVVSFLVLNRDKLNTSVVDPIDDNAYQSAMAMYAGITSPAAELENTNLDVNLDDSPIPFDLMETFSWEEYTIQRGDSISRIAASRSLSMDAVIALNGISNAKRIREGSVIRIPNMDGIPYTVRNGDSLSKISAKFEVPLEAILVANDLNSEVLVQGASLFIPGARMASEDLKKALGEQFLYPIRGRLTSPFGWRADPFTGVRRYHSALDLAAPSGTPIKASSDGTISVAGTNATYGKYIIITHSDGYNTMYAHMNKIYLNQGTRVLQGTVIGEVGSTGYSTGPHLHFGVFKNGRAVNPADYLN
jgi:murein DD-endopeptidase MepM/ murein hydrolase activator NlpD